MSDSKLITMSNVEISQVMQGDPGEGKTHLILAVTSLLTKGEPMPECQPQPPMNVIYQTAEDGLSDTIKPRLVAVSANCNRVSVINECKTMLSLSDERKFRELVAMQTKVLQEKIAAKQAQSTMLTHSLAGLFEEFEKWQCEQKYQQKMFHQEQQKTGETKEAEIYEEEMELY